MSGKYILDTNILIALFKKEEEVVKKISKAKEVFIPSIVIGELFYGAYKSRRVSDNVTKIDTFESKIPVLDCNAETAKIYGQIKT
ncbi:MAG: tRNA(fMet)-specific endonuclease VapC [Saprospiraceae bacterium]|jgi:tRNA(fMet)-specific endonuclease VapC